MTINMNKDYKDRFAFRKLRVRDVFTYLAVSRMENYDYHDVLTQ